jgi:hypothetical protein
MAPTYETRFIPRITTKQMTCEGAASCTTLTCEGAATCTTLTTGAGSLTAPAIVCPTDADTGLLWDGKDLQFAVDGSVRVFCTTNGLNTARYEVQSRMRGYRANGTDASPAATVDGNILFEFGAYGHNGTAFAPACVVRFQQDGAISGARCPGSVSIIGLDSSGNAKTGITVRASGTTEIKLALAHQGSTLGFFNTTPTTKPTITGSRGSNAALADLLTKLAGLGLLTDSTTA